MYKSKLESLKGSLPNSSTPDRYTKWLIDRELYELDELHALLERRSIARFEAACAPTSFEDGVGQPTDKRRTEFLKQLPTSRTLKPEVFGKYWKARVALGIGFPSTKVDPLDQPVSNLSWRELRSIAGLSGDSEGLSLPYALEWIEVERNWHGGASWNGDRGCGVAASSSRRGPHGATKPAVGSSRTSMETWRKSLR